MYAWRDIITLEKLHRYIQFQSRHLACRAPAPWPTNPRILSSLNENLRRRRRRGVDFQISKPSRKESKALQGIATKVLWLVHPLQSLVYLLLIEMPRPRLLQPGKKSKFISSPSLCSSVRFCPFFVGTFIFLSVHPSVGKIVFAAILLMTMTSLIILLIGPGLIIQRLRNPSISICCGQTRLE